MKITKDTLKQLIKEEITTTLNEKNVVNLPDDIRRDLINLKAEAAALYEKWSPILQKLDRVGLYPGPNDAGLELAKTMSAPINTLKEIEQTGELG
tara:strand:- start:104 stop:388 length:285 start_codon:yes stop_codon:yes gene_type:complete